MYLFEARRLTRVGNQGDAVADDGDVLDEDAERRVFVGRHLDDVDVELTEKLRQSQVLRPSLVQCHLAPRAQRQRDPAEDRVRVSVQRHVARVCDSLADEGTSRTLDARRAPGI